MPERRKHSVAAHVLLIATVLVWGATFPLVKAALAECSPLVFNLVRMTLASLILLVFNAGSLRGVTRRQVWFGAVAGTFLGIGYQFQTAGLNFTTPSKSAFLTGLVVVFVPLLSGVPGVAAAGTAKPGVSAYAGALFAFGGLIFLTTPPGSGRALLSGLGPGEWLTLACALAFAGHLLTLARGAGHVSARVLGTLQVSFCAVVMLMTLPLDRHPAFHLTGTVALALAVTAILATAVAFTVQSYAQQHLPATHTALIVTLEPVFAWLTSLVFYGERLGPRALGGAGLILAGILLAELGPSLRGTPTYIEPGSMPNP